MTIYDQHNTAFKNVSAYSISCNGERIGSIAFKRGQAITCYLHIFGIEMSRGKAGGGGYDRHSAAAYDAATRFKSYDGADPRIAPVLAQVQAALKEGAGAGSWDRDLRAAGFDVWQAV